MKCTKNASARVASRFGVLKTDFRNGALPGWQSRLDETEHLASRISEFSGMRKGGC
jgi:hypothetical protein